ncbi:MAG TPA: substrate-binding domain-containing protein [Rhodanobacteraceae bacterium]|nr:substrate-binding domain-containing protein [Rhodanobacteraceae bacterium]
MSRLFVRVFAALLLAGTSLAAIAAPPKATSSHPGLIWRGDLATARPLMEDLAKAWQKTAHGRITVQAFSTLSGLDALANGSADFAGSARSAFAKRGEEASLNFVPVAWDALVMAVHAGNPVGNVSLKQLHDIYYGRIDNWKALGGPDRPINLYSVASPLDGVEYSLREYLFRRGNQPVASPRLYINTAQLEAAIRLDPNALGVTTLSSIIEDKKLHMLAVEGVAPSPANVADGSYPLYMPLYLVLPPAGAHAETVKAFMEFLGSDKARKILLAHHVLPYDPTTPLAQERPQHLLAMQDISSPPRNGPVAAPGATYAAGATRAPNSPLTAAARARLEKQRAEQAANKDTATPPAQ